MKAQDTWTPAEAKAKFEEVIELAESGRPQVIFIDGRRAALVVAAKNAVTKTKRVGNLAEFFAASPLRGSGMRTRRLKSRPRA
jgi:hypothetical protein